MQLGSFEKYIPIDKTLALQDSGSSPARRGEKKKKKKKSSEKSKAALLWNELEEGKTRI